GLLLAGPACDFRPCQAPRVDTGPYSRGMRKATKPPCRKNSRLQLVLLLAAFVIPPSSLWFGRHGNPAVRRIVRGENRAKQMQAVTQFHNRLGLVTDRVDYLLKEQRGLFTFARRLGRQAVNTWIIKALPHKSRLPGKIYLQPAPC